MITKLKKPSKHGNFRRKVKNGFSKFFGHVSSFAKNQAVAIGMVLAISISS